jgi:hypothetical protein
MNSRRSTKAIGKTAAMAVRITLFTVLIILCVNVASADSPNDGPIGDVTEHSAIIQNGIVQLGVRDQGHLNVAGGSPANGYGPTIVGLRYMPTNGEATSWGCLCEGWGVADASMMQSAWANAGLSPFVSGMTLNSFTASPSTAVSVVTAFGRLRVTHDYHPAPQTPLLYEAKVTIQNISGAPVNDLRYTRVMDWDISPTPFSEYVTLQGFGSAANLLYANDDGFDTPDPLAPRYPILFSGNALDSGPSDHGALFDFGFGSLPPGQSISFNIYYGAAGSEPQALSALSAVGAEVYSLGQSSVNPVSGMPNTFVFAFSGVGGAPILNAPPVASTGGPYAFDEAGSIMLDATGSSDPNGDALTYSWSVDSALCTFDDPVIANPALTCADSGSYTVTLTVDDGQASDSDFALVTVNNVAPTLDTITLPAEPIDISSQPISVGAAFSDPASAADEPYTCTVDYGDGSGAQPATVSGMSCDGAAHTYAEAGVYQVTVAVTDKDGATVSAAAAGFVVIYDASAGYVTGQGSIKSPPGSYAANPSAAGLANFGFVSRYQPGAHLPTGKTQFIFSAAGMSFLSMDYDWLVVAGARAMYKGSGTINSAGDYGFMLTAVDGKWNGEGIDADRLRLKIWDKATGAIVYDNQMGDADDATVTTYLNSGKIVIHK